VGPRQVWKDVENLAALGFDPRTVQIVVSRYTDFFFLNLVFSICTTSVFVSLPWLSRLLPFVFTVHHTQHKHPRPRRDSNPQSQQATDPRYTPQAAKSLSYAGPPETEQAYLIIQAEMNLGMEGLCSFETSQILYFDKASRFVICNTVWTQDVIQDMDTVPGNHTMSVLLPLAVTFTCSSKDSTKMELNENGKSSVTKPSPW
jgi:hypothetical protein